MAQLGATFDATQVAPSEGRDVLPAGDYLAAIAVSEVRDAKKGGKYINLEFEVVDGPAKGRRFWSMLNLWNDNSIAVDIAQRELSAICHACGKLKVSDTAELHGIPMLVRLKIKSQAGYDDKNEVSSYKPATGAAPAQQSAPASAAAGGGGVKKGPWA
jgi:hypothetical protein